MTSVEEVLEEISAEKALAERKPEAEEKTEEDLSKLKQRKPPVGGLCRRCGKNKPINRLMLCYPCWVKTELENTGWREGLPHPDWCRCEGLPDHQRKSSSN
ncbi:MAG: hypothetical protein KGO96_03390 [Elusimicrobia bacterium]|nr:hypothetical protein [Elusimicrobiota bacterium]MDE2237847.1 hypothetical protein [Elusimicrobiota bacterium]MDE2424936.1 hypothetical protein [Elusimicrobiota bacterium]